MVRLSWERFGPLVIAALFFAASYWYGEQFFDAASAGKWHLDALYSSVFNIAAAAAAFMFAFYTYALTAEGDILREIRGSGLFKRAGRYMLWTIIWSGILAILTVPMVVAVPEPHYSTDKWYWIVTAWTGLTAYVFAAIVRSAYHFIAIMEAAFGKRLAG